MSNRINEAKWLEKHNRWQIKVQKEGVRKTFTSPTPGTKGKIECEKKADKWLKNGLCDSSIRFGKAYEMFLNDIKERTSQCNWTHHSSAGRVWLLPNLEHRKLSSITQGMLQSILTDAYKKGRSKKTISNIKGTLSSFTTFSKQQRWEFCGIDLITIPKDAPVIEKKILNTSQIKTLFEDVTDEFYIHAFRFLVLTGLRRGELCALMNSDIDESVIHVHRAYNKFGEITGGKTKNAQRSMALCTKAQEVLVEQKNMLRRYGIISPYVFPNKKGDISNSTSLYRHWWEYRKTIGLECSLHEFRHTLISYASAAVPEMLLKKTVGHSKTMDTYQYIHEVDDEAKKVAAMLDKRFEGII